MNSKKKVFIIVGLLIIAASVFYFYNFMILKQGPAAEAGSGSFSAKLKVHKLDTSFFSDIKLNGLRENDPGLKPVDDLRPGNPDIFKYEAPEEIPVR